MLDVDVSNFDRLRIGLVSSDQIRQWSRGEVKKPETIDYRTLKPYVDGLFCEKIFGPTKDWECYCGKYKRVRFKGIICERCGVEVTRAKVRRERMGHIELAAPVSHIWYAKPPADSPFSASVISMLLDIAPKDLEKVLYFASYIIASVNEEDRETDLAMLKDELDTDIANLDGEKAAEVAAVETERDRRIAVLKGEAEPDEGEVVDESIPVADQIKRIETEAKRDISDLGEEYEDRRELLKDAYDAFVKLSPKMLISDETLYREMKVRYGNYFRGGMGAEAIKDLLERVNLEELAEELRETTRDGKGQKRQKAVKRLKVVAAFKASNNRPEWMILDAIPVIPPDLRPMVQLDGGRFATSDLNDLYRRVINRNNRLKRLLDLGAPEIIVNNEKRMLQETVDALFDNGRRGRPVTGPGNRPLKSISDMLKGKQGPFRQNLLGKRVDYSGRSVIVVGPELKLHQCGLPKVMALELFKPFVMKRLVDIDQAQNIKSAKRMVDRQRPVVWEALEEVVRDRVVLLNRAPTGHRLGIQAFEPILVEGKAIRLHPLVCTAFNADFDGDQMAVHLPLSAEAQAEARILMLSVNNIKSPAHGRPLATPSQDMVIGMFYLTSARDGLEGEMREGEPSVGRYSSFDDAILAYDNRAVDLQAKIEVRLSQDLVEEYVDPETGKLAYREHRAGGRLATTVGRVTLNRSLPDDHPFVNHALDKKGISRIVEDASNHYSTTQMARILDEMKRLGFHYATRAGVTVSVYDVKVPGQKAELLAEGDEKVAAIEKQYDRGLITKDERHRQIVDVWTDVTEDVGKAMAENFDEFNPVYMMANSGARGNIKQIRQLAGMRGLMANPKGEILDRPIKANFREGLSVLEYFISTHGARKGLADTALRTADSGYLTRRLVDVAQDVIVRESDCETDQGVTFMLADPKGGDRVDHNLVGRCLLHPVVDPKTGEVIKEAGLYVTSDAEIESWRAVGLESVEVRAVMTCHAKHGVCQKCYGWDLASGRPVDIGTAVGIIAAQSIGEPGTQLTMRTFHTGGVAGEDITHGLPRVTELFEARRPKGAANLAPLAGILTVEQESGSLRLEIRDADCLRHPVVQEAQQGLDDALRPAARDSNSPLQVLAQRLFDIKSSLDLEPGVDEGPVILQARQRVANAQQALDQATRRLERRALEECARLDAGEQELKRTFEAERAQSRARSELDRRAAQMRLEIAQRSLDAAVQEARHRVLARRKAIEAEMADTERPPSEDPPQLPEAEALVHAEEELSARMKARSDFEQNSISRINEAQAKAEIQAAEAEAHAQRKRATAQALAVAAHQELERAQSAWEAARQRVSQEFAREAKTLSGLITTRRYPLQQRLASLHEGETLAALTAEAEHAREQWESTVRRIGEELERRRAEINDSVSRTRAMISEETALHRRAAQDAELAVAQARQRFQEARRALAETTIAKMAELRAQIGRLEAEAQEAVDGSGAAKELAAARAWKAELARTIDLEMKESLAGQQSALAETEKQRMEAANVERRIRESSEAQELRAAQSALESERERATKVQAEERSTLEREAVGIRARIVAACLAEDLGASVPEAEAYHRALTTMCSPVWTAQLSRRARLRPGVSDGVAVAAGQQLTEGSVNPHDLLELRGETDVLGYIVAEVQEVYASQGVDINDKHIEVIARQMMRKVSVLDAGDTDFLPGQLVDRFVFADENERVLAGGGAPATAESVLLGITKASLATDSYLSAASFQETTRVLTDAAIAGKEDNLLGLKENVIIGKLIPAATGMRRYRGVHLTYKGQSAEWNLEEGHGQLPDFAPEELKELEAMLPSPQDLIEQGGLTAEQATAFFEGLDTSNLEFFDVGAVVPTLAEEEDVAADLVLPEERPADEPVEAEGEEDRCFATTGTGAQCRNKALAGSRYCRTHEGLSVTDGLCKAVMKNGKPCPKKAREGSDYCGQHAKLAED